MAHDAVDIHDEKVIHKHHRNGRELLRMHAIGHRVEGPAVPIVPVVT